MNCFLKVYPEAPCIGSATVLLKNENRKIPYPLPGSLSLCRMLESPRFTTSLVDGCHLGFENFHGGNGLSNNSF